jgi:trehalose-6-phosphatase
MGFAASDASSNEDGNACIASAAVLAQSHGLRRMEGCRVRELVADSGGDKWTASRKIPKPAHALRRPLVYSGDDTTDEAVFRRMGSSGISIVVGRRPRRAAEFWPRSPLK